MVVRGYSKMKAVLVLLAACVAAAAAGRSPNADLVMEYMELKGHQPGARYSNNIIADALADVPDLIARYNYPVEQHFVTTSDGYILQMHRIPHGRDRNNQPGDRTAVYLLHGMMQSSADWVLMGPGEGLAYTLAEEGYDVWIGNTRGNYYSRNHTTLDPDDKNSLRFWQFSWDEMGSIDLPASIDYILNLKGHSKLHYVGFSQGSTVFTVMGSIRPEYNAKIISYQGVAPAVLSENNEENPINWVANYEGILMILANRYGIGELGARSPLFTWLGLALCSEESPVHPLCLSVATMEETVARLNATMIPVFIGHGPAGVSVRQMGHYAQCIAKGFRRYDYGLIGNLATYGTRQPPFYNLKFITAPTYLHYSLNDQRVNYLDVYLLGERISSPVKYYQVADEKWSHLDFAWGSNQVEMYQKNVISAMREAEAL
ncbi:lipase 1 [Plutella xylostella]|uniref:lipase 1 n=1 Tax=Plutella xylostella TaxID=51655 RepID=UPI0018D1CB07|nr:lipase 1 [Plutella xylostella]